MHSTVIGRRLVRGIWTSKEVMLSSFTSRKVKRTFHLENSTLPISKCLSQPGTLISWMKSETVDKASYGQVI